MPAPNVDLVFVVDASASMKPCFDRLRAHLDQLLQPMQGRVGRIRFGLIAQSVGASSSKAVYEHRFLCGGGPDALSKLYHRSPNDPDPRGEFFTDDPKRLRAALDEVRPQGNEDILVALDLALDFPFGPIKDTKRVVALFSDEPFEGGVAGSGRNDSIPALIEKIQARHIQLFCAVPEGPGALELSQADRSELEFTSGGEDGLASVDFRRLLGQMGKSISASSVQSIAEPPYRRAVFGEDRWGAADLVTDSNRERVLGRGEAATLDDSVPLSNIRVRMNWTRAIDLDLHAFYLTKRGHPGHVYFARKSEDGVGLDDDQGVGDRSGQNEENIVIEDLSRLSAIVFATNIFRHPDGRFADYDGRVVVETDAGDRIVVPLTAQQRGDWCVIASIINAEGRPPEVRNENRVTSDEPEIEDYAQ